MIEMREKWNNKTDNMEDGETKEYVKKRIQEGETIENVKKKVPGRDKKAHKEETEEG